MDFEGGSGKANGRGWGFFEVGHRSEETFPTLPEAGKYGCDYYVVNGLLNRKGCVPGKGGEVNRNEGTHS